MDPIKPADIDLERLGTFLVWGWMLALKHNGSVTGGCRTKQRNSAVGGHPLSRHQFETGWGGALDFVFDTAKGCKAAQAECAQQGYVFLAYDDKRRLHIQLVQPGTELVR